MMDDEADTPPATPASEVAKLLQAMRDGKEASEELNELLYGALMEAIIETVGSGFSEEGFPMDAVLTALSEVREGFECIRDETAKRE
jgi:hypothetical protein